MTKNNKKIFQRLPVTFHQTFTPERSHIGALLRFAASGRVGTDQEISAETGIPTGAINLDKQMRPWILTRRAEAQKYWRSLYDELA